MKCKGMYTYYGGRCETKKRTLVQGLHLVFPGHGKGETGLVHSVPAGHPTEDNFRMRLLAGSATKQFPEVSTATPIGKLKLASAPLPSANVALPLPASVETTPTGVTFRIRWLL